MTLDEVPCELHNCVASMLQLPVYRKACEILSISTKDGRRHALDSLPDSIMAMVEHHARYLYKMRADSARL